MADAAFDGETKTKIEGEIVMPRLSLRKLSKRYASTIASDAVSFDVMPGEIVALLGENGAGKSTLMKMAYGITQPDSGAIAVDGAVVGIDNPRRARSLGIAMVFQQFVLFDALSVLENVALGLPAAPFRETEARLLELAARYGMQIDSAQRVHDLSVGERQRVEILRALLGSLRILILDEPTSVLAPQAIDRLFDTLKQLAADGVSVIFISHKLHEIRRLASRCIVMRSGKVVAEVDPREVSEDELARLMLGAAPARIVSQRAAAGAVALTVSQLEVGGFDGAQRLERVSFEVRSGEIVGIAGIAGNGQAALLAALGGELRVEADAVRLFEHPVGDLSAGKRRRLGLRYVPEQRLGHAAVAGMSLIENAWLTSASLQSHGVLRDDEARNLARRIVERFSVRATALTQNVETLSGGNLQKYIVGREVLHAPLVLLINQPTWGVDAGSAALIRTELSALRAAGCAILLVSDDLDELYQLSDRLLVMANGRLSPSRAPQSIDMAELGRWMAGSWPVESGRLSLTAAA